MRVSSLRQCTAANIKGTGSLPGSFVFVLTGKSSRSYLYGGKTRDLMTSSS